LKRLIYKVFQSLALGGLGVLPEKKIHLFDDRQIDESLGRIFLSILSIQREKDRKWIFINPMLHRCKDSKIVE